MGNQNTSKLVLTKEQIIELERKTKLKAKDLEEWYKAFLIDHPDGKVSKEQFLEDGKDEKFWNHLFLSYNPLGSDLTFNQFVLAVDMISTDYVSLDELSWGFNFLGAVKGTLETNNIENSIQDVLNTFTEEELESLPEEMKTGKLCLKKIKKDFHLDLKSELNSNEYVMNIRSQRKY
eukprot:gene1081-10600_t